MPALEKIKAPLVAINSADDIMSETFGFALFNNDTTPLYDEKRWRLICQLARPEGRRAAKMRSLG